MAFFLLKVGPPLEKFSGSAPAKKSENIDRFKMIWSHCSSFIDFNYVMITFCVIHVFLLQLQQGERNILAIVHMDI